MSLELLTLIPALLAGMLWGIGSILYKYGSRYSSLSNYLLITNVSGLVFIFSFFTTPFSFSNFPLLFLLSLLFLIAAIAYYYALKSEDAHIVVPLVTLSGLFAILLACFFLNESLTTIQMIGAGMAIVGAMLVSLTDVRRFKTTPIIPLFCAFVCIVCWGLGTVLLKPLSKTYTSFQITAFVSLVFVLFAILLELIRQKRITFYQEGSVASFFAGFLGNTALVFEGISVSLIGAGLTSAILPIECVLPFIYEAFVEKIHIKAHRWIGGFLIVVGLVFVFLG